MSDKLPKKVIPHIPVDEWEKIVESARVANQILHNADFKFFLEYLDNARKSAIELVATNSVKTVVETITTKEGYSKSLKITKEEQLNEIAGQIKFIDKLLADLAKFASAKDEYEKSAMSGQVVIDSQKEDAK